MLASRRNGTLYTGVSNNVLNRTWQHKNDLVEGFTKKYGVHRLVWFETHEDINVAIAREKQIKGWNRAWKIRLIEKDNTNWSDLYWKITHNRQAVRLGLSWVPARCRYGVPRFARPGMTTFFYAQNPNFLR